MPGFAERERKPTGAFRPQERGLSVVQDAKRGATTLEDVLLKKPSIARAPRALEGYCGLSLPV